MRQEEIKEFLKTGFDELFWVRFKGLVDKEYLVIRDGFLIAFCVHQEKLEYYYETGFVLEPEKIFEIRSSGIPVSKAKLTGIDNEEFQRLRRSGLYMPLSVAERNNTDSLGVVDTRD